MKTIVKYPGKQVAAGRTDRVPFPQTSTVTWNRSLVPGLSCSPNRGPILKPSMILTGMWQTFPVYPKDPEKLSRMVYFTPFSRQIYDESYISIPSDPYEKAVWFLIRCNMGYGYRTNGYKVGWKRDVQGRERAYAAKDWSSLPGRVFEAAERLRGVQIECRPATELIAEYNYKNVLIYCDPPYMAETRSGGHSTKKKCPTGSMNFYYNSSCGIPDRFSYPDTIQISTIPC